MRPHKNSAFVLLGSCQQAFRHAGTLSKVIGLHDHNILGDKQDIHPYVPQAQTQRVNLNATARLSGSRQKAAGNILPLLLLPSRSVKTEPQRGLGVLRK